MKQVTFQKFSMFRQAECSSTLSTWHEQDQVTVKTCKAGIPASGLLSKEPKTQNIDNHQHVVAKKDVAQSM